MTYEKDEVARIIKRTRWKKRKNIPSDLSWIEWQNKAWIKPKKQYIEFDELKKETGKSDKELNMKLRKLMEEGYIYEPRTSKFAWLG